MSFFSSAEEILRNIQPGPRGHPTDSTNSNTINSNMAEKMLKNKLSYKDDEKETSKKSTKSSKKKVGQSPHLTTAVEENTSRIKNTTSVNSDADGIDNNFTNSGNRPSTSTGQVGLSSGNELSMLCQQMTSTITEQIKKGLNDIKLSASARHYEYDYEHLQQPFMYNDGDYENDDYEDEYNYDNNYYDYYGDQEEKIDQLCSSNIQNVDCERRRSNSKSTNLGQPEVDTGDENNIVVNIDTTKEDVLQNIAAELSASEQTSDKINTELADLVNSLVLRPGRDSEPDEKFKDRLKTTLRPENCASLVNTKVDELIWSRLQTRTKTFDIKLQYLQSLLLKGIIKTVKILDLILKEKDSIPNSEYMIKEGIYATGIFAEANYELNTRRRECIKPDINTDYKSLVSKSVPMNNFLFGGDTSKRLDEIEKTNKVVRKAMRGGGSNFNSSNGGNGNRFMRGYSGARRRPAFRQHPYIRGGRGQYRPNYGTTRRYYDGNNSTRRKPIDGNNTSGAYRK